MPDTTSTPHTNDEPRIPRIDPRLLELLVCPLTKTTLTYDRARGELISRAALLAYPIRDGVPILLEQEARRLDDGDPALRG